jgi:hypothetical protein
MDMINEIGRWLQEKEVLPTALERLGMADKLAEIVLISLGITVLLGILSCFFGLKLARFWSFLTVFVIGTGAAAAVAMQITSDETLSGIIGLAAGIILAIVFAILKRAGMFVTAFVLGAALSIYWLRPANLIWLLVCVGIGLVFALLTIKLFVPVLMLLTGVTGAVCISQAGTVLLGHAGIRALDGHAGICGVGSPWNSGTVSDGIRKASKAASEKSCGDSRTEFHRE